MDIKLGRLFWEITGDSAKLVQSMVQANNETQKFGSSMQKFGAKMSLFVTAPLLGIGGAALKSAADLEQSRIAFETMLGSAEAAQSLLKDIEQFAASTPFEMPGLVNGAKRLLAFGVSAGDVVEKMRNLGNAASGNSDQLDRLILAYGKLQAKGRASMEELNMFTEAGVPIIKALEKQMGVTTEELFKMISAGKIQFSDVDQALTSLTTGSGQFAGLIEKQSKTFSGALSTFKDNLSLAGRALVEGFLPPLTELLVKATKMVEGFSKLDDGTKKIILAGAAFLALIGPLATGIGTAIKVVSALKVAMVLLNSAMLANPVLAIITGIVAAGIAIGKVVSDIKKTTAELKEARTFDVTDDLDANIAKLAAFKKEVQDAFNRAAAATGREREMLRGSALQLASQYRLMEQQVEVQQAQFEEMDQVKRLQDKRLEQEQAITMEQQKQVVLQEELAAKVEQKYLDARAAVLDVLNSEKTEVQLLQEEIERLEKTPWGSGALEEDRLKAIAILRDRQRAAVAAEIEEREAAIKAEVEAYEAGVSEQEALDREATLESLTHAKELDKIDEENKQKAIDRVEEINNARLEAFQSAYNLASKLNDALSMLSDNELANQESAFNKKAELINAELDKQIQAGIEAGLITQKTLSYEEPAPYTHLTLPPTPHPQIHQHTEQPNKPTPTDTQV